ncbi:MAG: nitroreductase family protein [Erysipelothrix sp.]|nr:nitroreductase family protein [Erysipelothrix sp.]
MRKIIKAIIPRSLINYVRTKSVEKETKTLAEMDFKRFNKYSFGAKNNIDSFEQYEARIIKAYHSIEKGLSYEKIRLGFGQNVLKELIYLMIEYKKKGYSIETEFYSTALDNLNKYIKIHQENNYDVTDLKKRVENLGGRPNNFGGVTQFNKDEVLQKTKSDFLEFSMSRHSVRDFSTEPLDIEIIKKAINLAQNTPSACNRQAWKTRIVVDDRLKKVIENNQNGNRGFGDSIDKYILVTTDSQYFAKPRERNQPYIDGGMYSMNLLYSLQYYGIATIPLSASLTIEQEANIRSALCIRDSENFILIVGVGNYADHFKVPKSTRKTPQIEVL